jgi:hypothetical protein
MNSWPQLGSPLDLRAGFRAVLDVAGIDKPGEAVVVDPALLPNIEAKGEACGGIGSSNKTADAR